MGNRSFLYTADRMPGNDGDPELCEAVAEGNNFLPPLWRVLLSAAQPGKAQDFQQIFLPSIAGGIYAPRGLAEARLFRFLDCIAEHPMLRERDSFRCQVDALRAWFATLTGVAYTADLNEWFHLSGDGGDDPMDAFIKDCAARWERAEAAIADADHGQLERLFAFKGRDAADRLGFRCWQHAYFDGHGREEANETFEQFCLANPDEDGEEDDEDSGDHWLGHELYSFEENGKFGLRSEDASAPALLPAVYDAIDAFESDEAVATLMRDGLIGLYDSTGKILLEPMLAELHAFQENMAPARVGKLFGYLDDQARWLLTPRYDEADGFCAGMARIVRAGLHGYINHAGVEVIAPQFLDGSDSFIEQGYALVATACGFGVIDRTGSFVIKPIYPGLTWLEELEAWMGTHASGVNDLFYADGTAWFSATFDDIDCLVQGGDALLARGEAYGSIQRNGQPGLPIIYSDIALVVEAETGVEGGAPVIYQVTENNGQQRCGASAGHGELLVPIQFTSIDPITFVPYEDPAAAHWVPRPTLHLQVESAGGTGVWSLALKRQILDCKFDAVYGVRIGEDVYFVALSARRGWSIVSADGTAVTPTPYSWFSDSSLTGSEEHHAFWLGGELVSMWTQGRAISGSRGGQAWRLHKNGREQSELDYQLSLTRDPHGTPVVAMDSLVQGLPLPARAKRPVIHVIAGVCNPDACHALGDLYATGSGVEEDRVKALRWYATAAAGGQREAQYWYAYYLMDGLGCEADPHAARLLFESLGPDHARALNCLACLYEGPLRDMKRARALMLEAAKGEAYGYATAQCNAGLYWRLGKGGPADKRIALRYYEWADAPRQGGQPGDCDAAGCAAEIYCELALEAHQAGDLAEQKRTLRKAVYFYKKMIDYGLNAGNIALARCYLGIYGGGQQLDAARAYLRKALVIEEFRDDARALWDAHQLGR